MDKDPIDDIAFLNPSILELYATNLVPASACDFTVVALLKIIFMFHNIAMG